MGYQTPYTFVRRMTVLFVILGSLVCSLFVFFVHAEVQNIADHFQSPNASLNSPSGWRFMQCNDEGLEKPEEKFPTGNSKCKVGVLHPGYDLNHPDGQDSELKYKVTFLAAANGLVTYVRSTDPGVSGYGRMIIIEHTLPDSTKVWSVYAHLNKTYVTQGTRIGIDWPLDKPIGEVGKSGNQQYAHLHFEIRTVTTSPDEWTDATDTPNSLYNKYVDPLVFINNFNYYTSASTAGYVSLFMDSFFRGGALGYLHPGHYNLENTAFNNIVSSIGMGGLTATAYDQNTLSGDWLSLYDSDTNLANNGFTDGVSSKGSADNAISSLTIYGGDCSSQLIAASAQAATLGSSCNPNPAPAPGSQPLPPYTGSDTTPPRISAFNVSVSGAQAFLSVSASDPGGSGILDISYSARVFCIVFTCLVIYNSYIKYMYLPIHIQ